MRSILIIFLILIVLIASCVLDDNNYYEEDNYSYSKIGECAWVNNHSFICSDLYVYDNYGYNQHNINLYMVNMNNNFKTVLSEFDAEVYSLRVEDSIIYIKMGYKLIVYDLHTFQKREFSLSDLGLFIESAIMSPDMNKIYYTVNDSLILRNRCTGEDTLVSDHCEVVIFSDWARESVIGLADSTIIQFLPSGEIISIADLSEPPYDEIHIGNYFFNYSKDANSDSIIHIRCSRYNKDQETIAISIKDSIFHAIGTASEKYFIRNEDNAYIIPNGNTITLYGENDSIIKVYHYSNGVFNED